MSEGKDTEIKLFGSKIPLQEGKKPMEESGVADSEKEKDTSKEKANLELSSSVPNNPTEVATETSTETPKSAEQDDLKEAAISDQNKLLKKPDKVLPCPRCNSMDTKFCYYNNYNVNQPRHFCKNCQRYWTAGGSMRNVPVGAGRRKNKHGSPAARLTAIPPDSVPIDCRSLSSPFNVTNGTVLRFGPDAPLCESMASILSLEDQNSENQEEASCSSAIKFENKQSNGITTFPQLQYFPGPLWAYPWNPSWSNNGFFPPQSNQPPFFTSPLPFPFPPFCNWPWNLPTSTSHCSGNPNPTLGKHSREEQTEKSLWIPKTLRIDDPDEAAKSSIFATLGIEPDEGTTNFRAFSFKKYGNRKEEEDEDSNTSQLLRANPAASSRSQSFQEMTS